MNVNKMADNVLAAFLSAFFSWVFFFFLAGWCLAPESRVLGPECICLGMILALGLSGMRMSGMCEGRRPCVPGLPPPGCRLRLKSMELLCPLACPATPLCPTVSSAIMVMVGWVTVSVGPSHSSVDPGSRISIVYTCNVLPTSLQLQHFKVGENAKDPINTFIVGKAF